MGSTKTIKVDVRLVSATNKNLVAEMENGNFREDLYYRLNVILIDVPSLRERKEDIPLLVQHFIKEFAETNYKNVKSINRDALGILTSYDWPGNIRELRNIIERMVVMSSETVLTSDDIPKDIILKGEGTGALLDQNVNIQDAEKELIIQKLKRFSGNKSKAAKELGISRRTLYRKLEEYRKKK